TIVSPLGDFEYSINGTDYQAGLVFEELASGIYEVTVRNSDDTTCVSTATVVEIDLAPNGPDAPVSSGDILECAEEPLQTLDANDAISVGIDETVVWYDQANGGNIVATPILNSIGTVTYWAEAVSDLDPTCVSSERTSVTLTLDNCSIALVKEGEINSSGDCTVLGDSITYTFSVYNLGSSPITNIELTDPLLEDPNPFVEIVFVGGDDNNDNNLDINEIWIYTATYSISQADLDIGEVFNQATVNGLVSGSFEVSDLSGTSVENDNPTIIELCQDLSIELEKAGIFNDENGDGAAQSGETITYSFTVINTGAVTLYNIEINDPLVPVQGGPIASLEPGESDNTTFSAVYVITENDIDAGEVINQATVVGEDINGNTIEDLSDDPEDLSDVDLNGNGNPDDPTIIILPQVAGAAFEIYNGLTPNNDGLNDHFRIDGIEDYPNNNLQIFNRWGVLVFERDGYNNSTNAFIGKSEGRTTVKEDDNLPTGTYFYILTFIGDENPGESNYSGYLYLNR
ncbi:gliding motility-associated C-terminal domain-containing protein, partial [Planktosalinus lacus]|uniref:gliding motility-associated C-terminal domain-containing protein n=1 Tax=Planktosalinus lacus TaxID=1526573 RepID=UPI00166C0575